MYVDSTLICPTVMVTILTKNRIVTFLIDPAKLLAQYNIMLRSLMKNQRIPCTYASVGVATTTSPSYDTVMLHNLMCVFNFSVYFVLLISN